MYDVFFGTNCQKKCITVHHSEHEITWINALYHLYRFNLIVGKVAWSTRPIWCPWKWWFLALASEAMKCRSSKFLAILYWKRSRCLALNASTDARTKEAWKARNSFHTNLSFGDGSVISKFQIQTKRIPCIHWSWCHCLCLFESTSQWSR